MPPANPAACRAPPSRSAKSGARRHYAPVKITDLPSSAIYRRLLSYTTPHRRIFLLAILCMVALASTEWMLPALLKHLVDDQLGQTVRELSFLIPIALVVLFLVRGLLSYGSSVGLAWA